MNRTLILHDLKEDIFVDNGKFQNFSIINADKNMKYCIGCFNCWIKTPGECVIKDGYNIPKLFASHEKIILISRNLYGGYSPEIKNILDRSIGYILPFFKIVNNEMHHTMRYNKDIEFTVLFYGDNISKEDMIIGKKLVKANGINLGASKNNVYFYNSYEKLKEYFNENIIS